MLSISNVKLMQSDGWVKSLHAISRYRGRAADRSHRIPATERTCRATGSADRQPAPRHGPGPSSNGHVPGRCGPTRPKQEILPKRAQITARALSPRCAGCAGAGPSAFRLPVQVEEQARPPDAKGAASVRHLAGSRPMSRSSQEIPKDASGAMPGWLGPGRQPFCASPTSRRRISKFPEGSFLVDSGDGIEERSSHRRQQERVVRLTSVLGSQEWHQNSCCAKFLNRRSRLDAGR